MPTTKQRINISVPHSLNIILKKMSKKEQVPVATKALELLKRAIETEEDIVLEQIAAERDSKKISFISHDDVWN